jgi:transglutaminase-like putative cysteine protease
MIPQDTSRPWRLPPTTPIRERLADLDQLAAQGTRLPEVIALARAARQFGPDAAVAAAILRNLQTLPYVPDPGVDDYHQTVAYTLRHGGDCEDLVSALVAVARAAGLTARMVWIVRQGYPLDHVSAEIRLGEAWYWADPSIPGAQLGESPFAAMERLHAQHRV